MLLVNGYYSLSHIYKYFYFLFDLWFKQNKNTHKNDQMLSWNIGKMKYPEKSQNFSSIYDKV